MEIRNYLLQCEKCVDERELEKVMEARWKGKVKLTKLDQTVIDQVFRKLRMDYDRTVTGFADMAHGLKQLGQILGVEK